jgi:hypothetical protein
LSSAPRKALEEVLETALAARARQRRRRAERSVKQLEGREREVVEILLEATGGKAWPWPRHVHKMVAKRFGVGTFVARSYLAAVRRTIGIPVLAGERDGPKLMTAEWRSRAAETGDFGILGPLRPPQALFVR